MSLNSAHELIATMNAARAEAHDNDRSRHTRRREYYYPSSGLSRTAAAKGKEVGGAGEGDRQYDDEQDDDWWAKELEGDLEHCRRHGFRHRNGRDRHRDAQDLSREQFENNDVGMSSVRSRDDREREREGEGEGEGDRERSRDWQRDIRHRRVWSTIRAEAEEAEQYDYYRPHPVVKRRSRKHKHKHHRRSRDDGELETPLSPGFMPSPGGGIGAAIAAAAGIAGGIAGVEGEWENQVKHPADEIEMKPQKPWSVWDVKLSREHRKDQQASALASLTSLANHSTDMTTTLDSTYSSLFDKLTNLHAAIYAFKDLLDITSELRRQMTSSITELKTDADDRIKSVNKFKSQITKIDDLQRRMTDSHQRAAELNKRLDVARETISDWQKSEMEWTVNFRKKLRFGLSIFLGILSVIMMLCFLRFGWTATGQNNPGQSEDLSQTCDNPPPMPTFIFASTPSQLNKFATAAGRFETLDMCLDTVPGLAADV